MVRKLLKERLSEAIRTAGLNPAALAKAAGVPEEAITATLESGKVPRRDQEERIAKTLGVSVPYLMDWDSLYPYQEDQESAFTYRVIGDIHANGEGRIIEDFEDSYEVIPQSWMMDRAPEELFVIEAHDAAMSPVILPGDLLLVRKAPAVDNTDTAIVLLEGTTAGPRIVHYDDTGSLIRLEVLNPEYEDANITGDALERCHILGRVLRVIRVIP